MSLLCVFGQGVCSAYDVILAHGGVIGRTLILLVIGHSTRAAALWKSIPGTVINHVYVELSWVCSKVKSIAFILLGRN